MQFTTAAEAAKLIRSHSSVYIQGSTSIPEVLVQAMTERADELTDVKIYSGFAVGRADAPYCRPEYKDTFLVNSLFVANNIRRWLAAGYGQSIPAFLGEIPGLFCYHGSLKQVIGRLYKRHLPLEIFFQNNFKGEIFMSEQVLRGGNAMERSRTRTIVQVAMLGAVAGVLMNFEFPLPFLAPSFYQMDFSEIPVLIGSFAMGPLAGVLVELIKILVHLSLIHI